MMSHFLENHKRVNHHYSRPSKCCNYAPNFEKVKGHIALGLFIYASVHKDTVNLVLVRTVKNNYFSLCTN